MAHPLFLVECAVRKFVQHWYLGLQPTLSLRTLPIGEISVNIDVVGSTSRNCRHQKSGRRSREKRRNRRSSDIVLTNTVETSERNNKVEADDTVKEVRIECDTFNQQLPHFPQSYKNSTQNSSNFTSRSSSRPSLLDANIQTVITSIDADCQTDSIELKPKVLSVVRNASVSINPRRIYHPAIINASKSFFNKHPSELLDEEKEKFKFYLNHKRASGEPVETDIIYLPSSMRDCLHCGHPT